MRSYLFLLVLVMASPAAFSKEAKDNNAIRIITNNWTSQIVLAHITGKVFSSIGYPIEYLASTTSDQWGALAHGSADVQIEVWEGTMSDQFNRLTSAGSIIDAGSHTATTREDWWYPKYVEELCPGLPDWQALKDCAKIFSRPNSNGSGIYYAGPWEKPDEAKVRALDMDFKVHALDSGDDLWVELKKAHANKTPVVLFNWSPNWVESRFEGHFIEFPLHHPDCETDPSWGVNKQFLYDCGNPKGGWLKKATSISFAKDNSCAYQTLKNISFNNLQISQISALVDLDNLSYLDAADIWIKNNTSLWQSWIPKDCH